MAHDDEARRRRAAARADWAVRKFALGEEPEDDLSALTPSARVALVWQLTLDSWASMGVPMPTYTRAETPGKVVRRRHE